MPERLSDACFYVSDEPFIEIRDSMFHVTYAHGEWRFHVTMPPRVFLRALRDANRVAGEYEDGVRDTVVPIRTPEEEAAKHGH